MLNSLAKLVMLTAAILAAAPTGACCWGNFAAAASPKVGSCCQQKQAPVKHAPIAPANSKVSCCCQQPVIEQTKVTIERGDLLAAPLPVVGTQVLASAHLVPAFNSPLKYAGPPLNLLHCVWRC